MALLCSLPSTTATYNTRKTYHTTKEVPEFGLGGIAILCKGEEWSGLETLW